MTIEFEPYTVSGIVRQWLLLIIYLQLAEVHTEMQTTLAKHLLDLSQRLLTEIAEFHQVLLLIGHELAKAVDLGCLQTVEGAYREVQVFQRRLQYLPQLQCLLIDQVFLLLFFIVKSDVLICNDHQVLDQYPRSLLNGFLRMDGAVR